MANRTDPRAQTVHGTNPQFLIDQIVRNKIHNDAYMKEHCFALNAETIVDKAFDLKYVGGTYGGNRRPSKFLCLLMKMLQIQPEPDIVLEFIKNKDYKYIRILGAFYWRLVAKPAEIFQVLEPLYGDYRRVAFRLESGKYEITHVDEFVDKLLREEIFCEVSLPRIPKREVLEEEGELEPYVSQLQIEDQDLLEEEEESQKEEPEEEEKLGAGRSMVKDWTDKKVIDEVVDRRDGRDPHKIKVFEEKPKKKKKSSSDSGSSSSSEERRRKEKKREKKRKEKEKKKDEGEGDEYWMKLRMSLNIGK